MIQDFSRGYKAGCFKDGYLTYVSERVHLPQILVPRPNNSFDPPYYTWNLSRRKTVKKAS